MPGRGIELVGEPEVASHDTDPVKGSHPENPDRRLLTGYHGPSRRQDPARLQGKCHSPRSNVPSGPAVADPAADEVELTLVTMTFDASEPARLLAVLAKYVVVS